MFFKKLILKNYIYILKCHLFQFPWAFCKWGWALRLVDWAAPSPPLWWFSTSTVAQHLPWRAHLHQLRCCSFWGAAAWNEWQGAFSGLGGEICLRRIQYLDFCQSRFPRAVIIWDGHYRYLGGEKTDLKNRNHVSSPQCPSPCLYAPWTWDQGGEDITYTYSVYHTHVWCSCVIF